MDASGQVERFVRLRIGGDGGLTLEGQDLGKALGQWFGGSTSEYEWAWSLASDRVPVLMSSCSLSLLETDALKHLAAHLKTIPTAQQQQLFERAGAQFWSHSSD